MRLESAVLAIAVLGIAQGAHADAVDDFKNGHDFMLRFATITMGPSERSEGNMVLEKPSGTLDLTLAASDLGIPVPITVRARGTKTDANHVLYSVDQTFSPVGIGDGHSVSRIEGELRAFIRLVPQSATPRIGNVQLTLATGSFLTIRGTFGSQRIDIEATLYGGIPQPALDAFLHIGDTRVCSSDRRVQQPFAIWLAGPAQGSGATVELHAPHAGGIDLPPNVVIPAGRRSVIATAKIARGYTGTARLVAVSGGVSQTIDVTVRPHGDCTNEPASRPRIQPWLSFAMAGCTNCATFLDIDRAAHQLTSVGGHALLVRGTQKLEVRTALGNVTATAIAMTNDDTVVGTMTIGGTTQAYRANLDHGVVDTTLLGAMTPVAINNYNVVVGSRLVNGNQQAVYAAGSVVPLALTSAFGVTSSRAIAINDAGTVVGTYVDAQGTTRGFSFENGTTTTLPTIGTTPATPIAITASGNVLVTGRNASGPLSGVVSPANTLHLLGVPSGYATFEGRSINRYGVVVGVATSTAGARRAFLWRASRGFTPLSGYVANLVATDALHITDENQVVVRGTLAGAPDLYLLTL